jgi:polar amino acid transport system substrate-binding protein
MKPLFHPNRRGLWTRALFVAVLLGVAATAGAGTLDKVRDAGKLVIGFNQDARPFAYADSGGKAAGYAITLCDKVADAVKAELKLQAMTVEYVPLAPADAIRAVTQGRVDLLCGAVPTLERRALVDFSIPILLTGTGAAVRADAPVRLVQALSGHEAADRPIWRGSTDQAPQRARLAVIGSTPLEKALASRLKERRIVAEVVTVKDTDAGLQLLASGGADVFFSDRLLLLDAVARGKLSGDIVVLDRLFRRELVALAMRRDDDDFRLLVDRTLSHMYRTQDMVALYTRYFGAPGAAALDFFNLVALPD